MKIDEAKQKCLALYKDLWGEDWVNERIGSFGDNYNNEIVNGVFKYGIAQNDSLISVKPPMSFEDFHKNFLFGGEKRDQHHTSFSCNLETGEITVTEHY